MGYYPRALSLFIIGLILLAAGCDTPPTTQVDEQQEAAPAPTEQFFSYASDSIGPLLTVAIDTLQRRNKNNSFVAGFIKERGVPVWDGYHRFTNQKGQRILRVPVRAAAERTITGLIDITVHQGQPRYRWIARGTNLPGVSAQSLETIFWGYEKQVFGKTHTDEGARIKTKGSSTDSKQKEQEICTSTCAGPVCGDWECEGGGGDTGGDDGGFGSGGGDGKTGGGDPHGGNSGGGDTGGGSNPNPDPNCNGISGGHSMVPPQNEDPSNPAPPPCEEDKEEEEDGNDASFMGIIGIDTKELDKYPKLKCTVDRVLDTNNMQDLIAEFGMAYTNYDLIFSGRSKIEDKNGEYLGNLDVVEKSNSNDQFIVLANNNLARVRSSVKVAVTYLHEAMHAEMRRYLLDNANTSTLPNFPGSITEDWKNYVSTRNDVENAEHQAMGYKEYIALIAEAASDFDNGKMPLDYYKALSWEGIWEYSDFWGDLTQKEKDQVGQNYINAQEKLENRSFDYCK